MSPSRSPFTGEYPTVGETSQALFDNGFGNDAATVVTSPMNGATGPLAEMLTECKSANLSQNYPELFNVVVKQMIKAAKE